MNLRRIPSSRERSSDSFLDREIVSVSDSASDSYFHMLKVGVL